MYYIYHIPNIKIGCTDNVERRVSQQGFNNFQILEKHTDIMIASKREQELQKEYGYKVDDCPYHISVSHWGSKAGKNGAKKHFESGHIIKLKEYAKEYRERAKIKIKAYKSDTLELVGEFESLNEAADKLNVLQGNITHILNGRRYKTRGYTFKKI